MILKKALFVIVLGMSDRRPAGPHLVTEVGCIADAVGICGMTPSPELCGTTHCGYAGSSVRTAWRTRRPDSILQSVDDTLRTGKTLPQASTVSCAPAYAENAPAELQAEHPIDLDLTDDLPLGTIGCGGILRDGTSTVARFGTAHGADGGRETQSCMQSARSHALARSECNQLGSVLKKSDILRLQSALEAPPRLGGQPGMSRGPILAQEWPIFDSPTLVAGTGVVLIDLVPSMLSVDRPLAGTFKMLNGVMLSEVSAISMNMLELFTSTLCSLALTRLVYSGVPGTGVHQPDSIPAEVLGNSSTGTTLDGPSGMFELSRALALIHIRGGMPTA